MTSPLSALFPPSSLPFYLYSPLGRRVRLIVLLWLYMLTYKRRHAWALHSLYFSLFQCLSIFMYLTRTRYVVRKEYIHIIGLWVHGFRPDVLNRSLFQIPNGKYKLSSWKMRFAIHLNKVSITVIEMESKKNGKHGLLFAKLLSDSALFLAVSINIGL